jgi:hypothetical protein
MPLLSTFGAASARGWKSSSWETNTQYFAIGAGGSAKLTSLTIDARGGNSGSATNTFLNNGYPGQVASNTQFVPMASGQTLGYRASGTNADGSGSSLKIKSGETYTVLVGAPSQYSGGPGPGGSTSVIKDGTTIITAAGGAEGDTVATNKANNFRYDAFDPDSYAVANYYNGWDSYTVYTYMYLDYLVTNRPSLNASADNNYKLFMYDNPANWLYWAYYWANSYYAKLPHNSLQVFPTTSSPTNQSNPGQTNSRLKTGIAIPMLPQPSGDIDRHAGGANTGYTAASPYWNASPFFGTGYERMVYGSLNNFNIQYWYPNYLFLQGTSADPGGIGQGGGPGGSYAPQSDFASSTLPGYGAFVLAYPASLPPLSFTAGLATEGDGTGVFQESKLTSNPDIINKNGTDYRVYVFSRSGMFTV